MSIEPDSGSGYSSGANMAGILHYIDGHVRPDPREEGLEHQGCRPSWKSVPSKTPDVPRTVQVVVVLFSVLVEAPFQAITFVAVALLLMGHLAVAYDPLRRAWHDKLGGTYVVRAPRANYIPPGQ